MTRRASGGAGTVGVGLREVREWLEDVKERRLQSPSCATRSGNFFDVARCGDLRTAVAEVGD